MYSRYSDRVDFYSIYLREAHPTDGWRLESNDRAGIMIANPKTIEEREKVAATCCEALQMSMPLLVDTIDNAVGEAYSGFPDRLYIIDLAGRVAYKGGRGPVGFDPRGMEQALLLLLLESRLAGK